MESGAVHMVETQLDQSGSLGVYYISRNEMSYSNDKLSVQGDGLVMTDKYMFVSSWVNGGQLMALDRTDILYTDDGISLASVFEVVLTNLTSPADMCLGPDNVVVVPSLFTGKVSDERLCTETELTHSTFVRLCL